MNEFEDEIPVYKKKSSRHPPQKSKHKHSYKPCLLRYSRTQINYCLSEYCEICGKIGNTNLMESEPYSDNFVRLLSNEEKLEKHKDLEIFEVNDLWDKYVTIIK